MRTRGELDDEGPHSWNPISSRKHPLASFLHSEAKKTTSFSSQSRNCPDFQQNLFPYLLERYLINGSFVWSLISYFALNYESPPKVSGGNFPFFVVSHASVSFKLNNPNFYILGFLCPNLKLHFFHSGTLP